MKPSLLRTRYLRILTFFIGILLRLIFTEVILARLGLRTWIRRTRPRRLRKEATRFRDLAIRMGGVMIKVGQFLSSRLDVLPADVTEELAGLQDEVPAVPFPEIRQLAERELGIPLETRFEWVEEQPLAAASLGQVHRARLKLIMSDSPDPATGGMDEGEYQGEEFSEVVIKVQRPHIESIVEVDLAALRRVGEMLMRFRIVRERADVPALLREFSATVREEIDYLQEAENARRFYENFREHEDVHVPRVVSVLTTRRVLTLEDVYAIKITDYDAITAAGIDRKEVARRLLGTYLKQIFEDGFVHADPHPGNLFVTPVGPAGEAPPRWQLTFVDFGMTVRVNESVRAGLREMVIGVGTRDAARVVKSYQMLDMLLPGADLKAIEQMEAKIFNRFWGMSMSELRQLDTGELRKFAHQYRDMILQMPFQVPQDLLYLVRTVGILSGMCTGLDPDFNVWEQISPYARKLVAEEAPGMLDALFIQLGDLLKGLLALPAQMSRTLARVERGEMVVDSPQVLQALVSIDRSVDRLAFGLIFGALLIGGVLLYNAGNTLFGQGLLGISGLFLLWIVFRRRE
jgi:predicted unusual protein kinase regulating ubiquinone biosynthesis (AarF/ABC1/UbiB family)